MDTVPRNWAMSPRKRLVNWHTRGTEALNGARHGRRGELDAAGDAGGAFPSPGLLATPIGLWPRPASDAWPTASSCKPYATTCRSISPSVLTSNGSRLPVLRTERICSAASLASRLMYISRVPLSAASRERASNPTARTASAASATKSRTTSTCPGSRMTPALVRSADASVKAASPHRALVAAALMPLTPERKTRASTKKKPTTCATED
mmetsp:Transcript_10372/g.42911  ORF Transcript_10372/g.42911 Transcript_10372/m.42911 type:complete len:209 (-) Transcript_10372:627-1253(-)